MITRERLVQEDGAVWQQYRIEGGSLTITGTGQELLRTQPEVRGYIRDYSRRVLGQTALSTESRREYMGYGDHAFVFYLTDDLVIKEGVPEVSLHDALRRMDTLYGVIKDGVAGGTLPAWIDMPDHHGVLASTKLDRQYMLMDCVDSGITVKDILDHPGELPSCRDRLVAREFGRVTEPVREEINYLAFEAVQLVTAALEAAGRDPEIYLGDMHQGNMLVEQSAAQVDGQNFKMWIIDQ